LFEARAQTLPLEEPKEGDGGHGHEESDPLAGGTALAVQVLERRTQGWLLSAFGTTYEVLTRAPREAELSRHMKPPPRSLLDNALLSAGLLDEPQRIIERTQKLMEKLAK
jgi:hypothetical protein